MTNIQNLGLATAFASILSVSAPCMAEEQGNAFGIKGERGSNFEIMSPDNGLRLDIGSKQATAVLTPDNGTCRITLVLADGEGAPATRANSRIVVAVLPGNGLLVDSADGGSAEFVCGQGGQRMNARVYDRRPYRS